MPQPAETALAFATPEDFRGWLAGNHDKAGDLWIRMFKKASGTPSVDWGQCVVEAIAWGWIDGKRVALDEQSFLQRFTPRRRNASWSQKNIEHAERLIAEGRMMPAGLVHVEAAKADGRWESGYAGSAGMVIPRDFLDALEERPAAKAFFATLDRRNLFPIYYRLHTAKRPETRAKRMAEILARLERGERFY